MWGKRILANSKAKANARLLLMALGECADKNGYTSATVADLARYCQVSARQVQLDLVTLQESGELELIDKGGGRGNPATYRILIEWQKGVRFYTPKRVKSTKGVYAP